MLNKLKNIILLSSNRKNIIKISSGTMLGQAISIITLPIITRIYGAEIIGLWALLNSIAIIINSFSDLGLTNSIMVEADDNVEKNYRVITTLSAIISIVTSAIITLFYVLFSDGLEMNSIFFFVFLMTIAFTLQQIQICYTWLNRNGNYNVLMKNPLINNGFYGVLAIVLGFLGFKIYGYFIAHIIGQVVTLLHMKRNLPGAMFTFKLKDFKYVIKKNKRFVVYQTPTNIIGKFKSQLPTLLIKIFWGTEILGYYSITLRLLQIPSALLASAIGRVFFQATSAMKKEGKAIGQFVYKNIDRTMKIAVIPITLLIAFGDVAAIIFLGKEWAIAGDFVRILALQYFFTFIMTSVKGLSITLDKQNYAMMSITAQLVICAVSMVIGKFVFDNIIIALLLMSSLNIIINIIYFCTLFKVMEIPWKKYVKNVALNVALILGLSSIFRISFNALGLIDLIHQVFNIQ